MSESHWKKLLQKKVYDILSHKHGLLISFICLILLALSAFHFGESVLEWSTEKYAAVFNSFSDNLAGKSFRERLCLPVPIDVVYTWVNGTDTQLIRNIQRLKVEMQDSLNTSSERTGKCVFSNCVMSNKAVVNLPSTGPLTLNLLKLMYPAFSNAQEMYKVMSPIDYQNYTVLVFPDKEQVAELVNKTWSTKGVNMTVMQGHITSDATVQNGVPIYDQIIMSGFPHTLTAEELKLKLPEKHQTKIDKFELDTDKGFAVLYVGSRENFDHIMGETNFTIDGKEPTLSPAHLVWDLRDFSRDEDISASRFEDNEELRYSLRSIERFAPWVRHVYIVTNGQLPYWLNLESSRVTIVTHEEIFSNKSHLPSFGSPAIESNLHKIPGLSDKFIYMNDDVMFGREVWPDDFYTYSSGQKVYLTWPVPNCNEGCPSSWIKDGYCDKACNVSECEWDAGDCDGSNANAQAQMGWGGGGWNSDTTGGYCHTGCANNWIADRYCDTACNVLECGLDAGDCGTDKFSQMFSMPLTTDTNHYKLPAGLIQGYFNLSDILRNTTLKQAYYDDNKVVRTIAVAKKFQVLTVVLYSNKTQTSLNFTLEYGTTNTTKQFNFTLEVNTMPQKTPLVTNITVPGEGKNISMETNRTRHVTTERPIIFEDLPVDQLNPVVVIPSDMPNHENLQPMPVNMSNIVWPDHLVKHWTQLQNELKQEELTETGYRRRLEWLWLAYQQYRISNPQTVTRKTGRDHLKNTKIMKEMKIPKDNDIVNENKKNDEIYRKDDVKFHRNIRGDDGILKAAAGDNVQSIVGEDNDVNVENKVHQQAGRRKLLNYINTSNIDSGLLREVSNIEVELLRDVNNGKYEGGTEFVDNVNIQPDSVKLLPWERGSLGEIQKVIERQEVQASFHPVNYHQRRLLDTFGDSLRHVNSLYNKAFGYTARKVPGHMPHMIDRHIMKELQDRFPSEWDATSSHKVRHSKDMQYAFSYFYYLMGVKHNTTAAEVFDEMDTDKSKILSDREIRTLATRLYDLPLDLQTLTNLEFMFVNCSKSLPENKQNQLDASMLETYYEKEMPQVTRNLFINCKAVLELVEKKFPPKNKYKHVEVDDSHIAFKMIKSNISTVVGQLDDIRKHPKKFICLNDNIDHTLEQAKTVKAILADFYESQFPIQSQFELQREYRNRFTHIDELREWRRYRDWLKFWTHIALVLLVVFTIASYFSDKIEAAQRVLLRRRSPASADQTSDSSSSTSQKVSVTETV